MAAPAPLELIYTGPLKLPDTGDLRPAAVRIRNRSDRPVVLVRLNAQTFGPPDFARLERMKAPAPRWSEWRNVLGPGQETARLPGGDRLRSGHQILEIAVEYQIPSPAFVGAHVQEIVPPGQGGPGQLESRFAGDQPRPIWVVDPSTLQSEGAGARRRLGERWSLSIAPDPIVSRLPQADRIERFAPALPFLGHVVIMEGQAWRVEGARPGTQPIEPIGQVGLAAAAALGRALAGEGRARVRAGFVTDAMRRTFHPHQEAVAQLTMARVAPWQGLRTWHTFEVTPGNLEAFWQLTRTPGVMLLDDPAQGLILLRGPPLP